MNKFFPNEKREHYLGNSYTEDEFQDYLNSGVKLLPIRMLNNYVISNEGKVFYRDTNDKKIYEVEPWIFNDILYVSLFDSNNDDFKYYKLGILVITHFMFVDNYAYYKFSKCKCGYYDNDFKNCNLNNLYISDLNLSLKSVG